MGDLLQFLGEVLSNMMLGHPPRSKFMKWLERTIIVIVTALVALAIYRMYSS